MGTFGSPAGIWGCKAEPLRRRLVRLFCLLSIFLPTVLFAPKPGAQSRTDVDVAIVLAVDCSYSVNAEEFRQQMIGLAEAFRNPDVQAAIQSGATRTIAISLVQWAGPGNQSVVVPWRIVSSTASALRLANEIAAARRLTAEGATSVTSAIDAGVVLHLRAPVRALRRIIDISADGYNNAGGKVRPARNRAAAAGITINALAILNEYAFLQHWYRNHVIAGPGAFVEVADDYTAYAEAIRRKLLREIQAPVS